jgi:mannose-6-phosphate isomerase
MRINFDKACDTLQNMDIAFVIDNLSVRVDFIRIERFKPGMGFDDHAHSNFEFHYIKSGEGRVTIGGKPYDLVPGSVYVTGKGVVHNQLASVSDPMVEYAMKCSIGLVDAALDPGLESEEGYIISVLNNNPGFVVQDLSGMDALYETLFEEASAMRPGYFGQIKALIYRIILATARMLDPGLNAQYNIPYRNLNICRLEAARRYIADNMVRSITCRELSRHLFLSEKQFGRIIKAETGMMAHDFILSEKLGRVKQLLQETDLTLHSISELTGFSSEFHLSSIFRKKVGISPHMYRKQLKDGTCHGTNGRQAEGSIFYPVKFRPLYKDYIWGGRNLERLGKILPEGKVAESWEISAHHDGMNIVSNGCFGGSTLEDLILEHGADFVGSLSWNMYKKRFPLLLKLIDANEWLSVQVHPDDDYSAAHENDAGKTEIWFVLEAEPDARIIYGLKEPLDREGFSRAIGEGRIEECLRYVNVRKGDMIYIPAGTIHAAGKGILIAEIQQSSNATYRLYDYDRKNPDGTSRPLHIEKALDSIDFSRVTGTGFVDGLATEPAAGLRVRYMVADPHFCVQILEIDGSAAFPTGGRSFHALIITSGGGEISWGGGTIPVKSGESILIPAGIGRYSINGSVTVLKSFIGELGEDIVRPLREAGYSEDEIRSRIAGL